MRMFHEFHIQKPVAAKGPEPAGRVMIKILDNHDLTARHPPHFFEKRLWVRHVMKHGHENRHIKTLIRKWDLETIIQHHRRLLVAGVHDIQNQMLMPSLFERLGVKTPTAPQIQDPASPRDLIFKKLNDLFCPDLESAMSEMPDDPVQYPALKDPQVILNGVHDLVRYGF